MNMSFLQELFSNITQRDMPLRRRDDDRATADHEALVKAREDLLKSAGEASSIALASRTLAIYARLDDAQKQQFCVRLADHFAADAQQIDTAYAAYRDLYDNT